jgi:23S rRNA pseudouridine1911/1915/1917 synthase
MKKIFCERASEGTFPIKMKDYLHHRGLSVTLVKKAKYGGIHLNGVPVTVRAEVNVGDLIEIYTEDNVSEGIPPMDIPLTVIYEDDDILAVDKPTDMPTHPSKGNNLPTLANAVMGYYGGDFVFRSVNRLDRDTSGIVIIAKNQFSAGALSSSMKKGLWNKKYHALVSGIPSEKSGVIDAPIERVEEGNIKRMVREDGKRAITEYSVIEEYENRCLCELHLLTGRTHQIRVHMAYIGHPLVSDFLYGTPSDKEYYLRCKEISFPHPKSGELVIIKA